MFFLNVLKNLTCVKGFKSQENSLKLKNFINKTYPLHDNIYNRHTPFYGIIYILS